ncbi:Protein F47B7.1 [Aphelenchoides avenae]|nr:Protein F47B7.1 [Aphelenchus avenae]
MGVQPIIEVLLIIFGLSPLAVLLHANECNGHAWLNLLLLLLLPYIGGVIHACWYCFCRE